MSISSITKGPHYETLPPRDFEISHKRQIIRGYMLDNYFNGDPMLTSFSPDNLLAMYELYDIWYEPFWHEPWFWYFVGFLGFILLGIIVWFCFVKKRKTKATVHVPWQEALASLKAINLDLYSDHLMHKVFYVELTTVLKTYLSKRYQLQLASCTDQEVAKIISKSSFPTHLVGPLERIVNGALVIKFANKDAAVEQMKYDLIRSIDIISQTIPPPKNLKHKAS